MGCGWLCGWCGRGKYRGLCLNLARELMMNRNELQKLIMAKQIGNISISACQIVANETSIAPKSSVEWQIESPTNSKILLGPSFLDNRIPSLYAARLAQMVIFFRGNAFLGQIKAWDVLREPGGWSGCSRTCLFVPQPRGCSDTRPLVHRHSRISEMAGLLG